MINIARKRLIPSTIRFTKDLADDINAVRAVGVEDVSVQLDLLKETQRLLKASSDALSTLIGLDEQAAHMKEGEKQARYYHDVICPAMTAYVAIILQLCYTTHVPCPLSLMKTEAAEPYSCNTTQKINKKHFTFCAICFNMNMLTGSGDGRQMLRI